ncbi:unnamed protein product [Ceratitis capitata]|uniref:(Mediterranean fruit fly) hypothetical protein n=1 Tax=Ceratitis capitata TaxID=7213 RepID=A0A811UM54_CERCA|nr:unnamed protein product [Ceratitis capitata]
MMENQFTSMVAATGLAVVHSVLFVEPIYQSIFDCMALYDCNDDFYFVFEVMNRLSMVSIEISLNCSSQKQFNGVKPYLRVGQSTSPFRIIIINGNGSFFLVFKEKLVNVVNL